ncbi:MAG: hypothetical protein COB24_10420 [Hyphomicrobiales bacterium]|nr:MAG: hypothetical protein COB24_10420 [Hyphomicrobiales bacterium]
MYIFWAGKLSASGVLVAREFGLPAVVNAAGAFDAINVGDKLIVDGNVGQVKIRR